MKQQEPARTEWHRNSRRVMQKAKECTAGQQHVQVCFLHLCHRASRGSKWVEQSRPQPGRWPLNFSHHSDDRTEQLLCSHLWCLVLFLNASDHSEGFMKGNLKSASTDFCLHVSLSATRPLSTRGKHRCINTKTTNCRPPPFISDPQQNLSETLSKITDSSNKEYHGSAGVSVWV